MDKAQENNYRPAASQERSCYNCTVKVAVPYCWCDTVGRTAEAKMICDGFKGVKL